MHVVEQAEPTAPVDPATVVTLLAMADYRQAFVDEVASLCGDEIRFVVGDEYFDASLPTAAIGPSVLRLATNRYFLGGRLAWQSNVIGPALHARLAIVDYNPRIISSVLIVVLRRLQGRPTALWGHAWSRAGPSSWTEPVRTVLRRLAGNVLVYTHQQAAELQERDARTCLYVVPNSLYSRNDLGPALGAAEDILFVGRLVESKKPSLLLDGYLRARAVRNSLGVLHIVGDGPERDSMQERIRASGTGDHVRLVGHMSDHRMLRHLYGQSLVAVSPGYVGLSATQAIGFGVPVVYPDRDRHAPEVAVLDSSNSMQFSSDDPDDLARAILEVHDKADDWRARRASIAEYVLDCYTVEVMAARFVQATRLILKRELALSDARRGRAR